MRILGLLISAGLILVILGVALSIGAKVTDDVDTGFGTTTATITAEVVAITDNATLAYFAHSNVLYGNYTGVSVTNETEAGVIIFPNYTLTSEGIYMGTYPGPEDDGGWNGDNINVTYTYIFKDIAASTAANASIAIGTLAEWEDTVATVIAAVVVIGLLMAGFGTFLAIRGGGI